MSTRYTSCLFIENEEQLHEIINFLKFKGEIIFSTTCYISPDIRYNYLSYGLGRSNEFSMGTSYGSKVTTEQFKKLWE